MAYVYMMPPFEDFFGHHGFEHCPAFYRMQQGPSSFPGFGHVQLARTGSAARLVVLLPGIPRDQLKLEVLKRTLTIEVPAGSSQHSPVFSRTFELGETIDADAISADLDLGLLTVNLPYKSKSVAVPRRVAVGGVESSSSALEAGSKAAASEAHEAEAHDADAHDKATDASATAVQEMAGSSKGEWVDVREAAEEKARRSEHSPASSDDEDGSIEDCPVDAEP